MKRIKTKWFQVKQFIGERFDAEVQTTMNGTFRVVVENISTGEKRTRIFRGENARQRAIECAGTAKISQASIQF